MRTSLSRRVRAGLIAFALVVSQVLMPVQSAFATQGGNTNNNKKVYVCKYVGTPGIDERLQTGQNPIEVSVNAISHNDWNGTVPGWFSDAHDRSYVLGYVPMSPVPTSASCPAPEGPEEIPVPTPMQNDPCGPNNATWIKPADTDQIDWSINWKGELIAEAERGYVFANGEDTINFGKPKDSNVACDVVIPVPPKPSVTDPCGPNNATWNVPMNTAQVTWSVNGMGELVATAANGYVFTGGGKTVNYGKPADSGVKCEIPVPPTPKVIDFCNIHGDNAFWVKPQNDQYVSWSIVDGELIATAQGGYTFPNQQATHNYGKAVDDGVKCAWAKRPTKSDTCGEKNDTYTIPYSHGVQYEVNGVPKSAGTYQASGWVHITAHAKEGYKLLGEDSWKFHFTDRYCKPEVKAWLKTFCYADGQYFKLGLKNNTDSKQKYEVVITDSEGNEVKQAVVYLHSGQYDSDEWMTNLDGDYTFSIYSYDWGKRGYLLWEQTVTTTCATDVFTPEIYKRDQYGNLLPGAKFTIEVCQYVGYDKEVRLDMVDMGGWVCQSYTNVDLGSYTDGDWFEQNVEYRHYVPTTVTVTETYAPGTCEMSGPWKFSWNFNQREEEPDEEQPALMLNSLNRGYNHHMSDNMGAWDNGTNVWELENNCPPGNGGVTPDPTEDKPVGTVTELPQTGPGGTLTTFLALFAALVTYGAAYFLQTKKQVE